MRDWQGKRYWLVGATSGLGREVALGLSSLGCILIVSDGFGDGDPSARAEALDALTASLPGRVKAWPIDTRDAAAVEAAASEIGDIDGLVHLAAPGRSVAVPAWDGPRALNLAETNFMGALRCVNVVLPGMLARDAGHIVLSGSTSGLRGDPGYAASTAATAALAQGLRSDLRSTGVSVQRIDLAPLAPGQVGPSAGADAADSVAARSIIEHMGTADFARRLSGRHWLDRFMR